MPAAPTLYRAATSFDVTAAASIVAAAFTPLWACEWLVPDPVKRTVRLRDVFAIEIAHALEYGHVDLIAQTTPGHRNEGAQASGVAVWFHHDGQTIPAPDDYDRRLTAAAGPYTDRFRQLDALFEAHHPREAGPHHHLAFLAAVPTHQGMGAALLRHYHAVLDTDRIPAYLEASSPDSRRLYTRHHYRPTGEFQLPNEAIFYPMWRPHQGGDVA